MYIIGVLFVTGLFLYMLPIVFPYNEKPKEIKDDYWKYKGWESSGEETDSDENS